MYMDQTQPTEVAQSSVRMSGIFSQLERLAIAIGLSDGRTARRRSPRAGLLIFFDNPKPMPLANNRLEALRSYVELASALFPRRVAVTTLVDAGFSPTQIQSLPGLIEPACGRT